MVGSGDDAAVVRCGRRVGHDGGRVRGGRPLPARRRPRCGTSATSASPPRSRISPRWAPSRGEAYFALGPARATRASARLLELTDGAEALAAGARHDDLRRGPDRQRRSCSSRSRPSGTPTSADQLALPRRRAAGRPRSASPAALGGSGAGTLLLERKAGGLDAGAAEPSCSSRHLRPRPLVEAGRALARAGRQRDDRRQRRHRLGRASASAERSGVLIEIGLDAAAARRGSARRGRGGGHRPVELAAGAGRGLRAAVHGARASSPTRLRRPPRGRLPRHLDRRRAGGSRRQAARRSWRTSAPARLGPLRPAGPGRRSVTSLTMIASATR